MKVIPKLPKNEKKFFLKMIILFLYENKILLWSKSFVLIIKKIKKI